MRHRPRAFCAALASGLILLAACPAAAAPGELWEVTLAARLTRKSEESGPVPMQIRVSLPPDTTYQKLVDVGVKSRGLAATVHREPPHPHVILAGVLGEPRRVAVILHVRSRRWEVEPPALHPLDAPAAQLIPFLVPAPLFQSRSILVREFLETHVAPRLDEDAHNLLDAIYTATRQEIEHRRDGKSLPLDVIRRGHGKRIGIERVFTTFLRSARVPARFVEGVKLESSTRRKRTFWTEIWATGGWFPVSASRGRIGEKPAHVIAIARDGLRVFAVDGAVHVEYTIQTRKLPDGMPTGRPLPETSRIEDTQP